MEKETLPNRIRIKPYNRVVLLALDGLGTYFTRISVPWLDAFFASGTSTLGAKAQIPSSSAENWGSILHGVTPQRHGLTNDVVNSGKPFDENSSYPSIYKILEKVQRGSGDGNGEERASEPLKLASFVAWEPINTGIIELSIPADRYAPNIDEGFFTRMWLKFKKNVLKNSTYDTYVTPKVCDYIRDKKNSAVELLTIHLVDVDEHGHAHGWGSENYLEQMAQMDSCVGEILQAINNAGWTDDTLIVMTTDHGGINYGHGGTILEEATVFLALNGPGIARGAQFKEPVTNMDCAAIILTALGIEVPDYFDSKVPKGIFPV